MRARRYIDIGALLGLAGVCMACGPVAQPPGSPAPANVCGGSSGLSCNAFPVNAGATECTAVGATDGWCVTNTVDEFVLVVTASPFAPLAAGSTFAISTSTLYAGTSSSACTYTPYVAEEVLPDEPETTFCYRLPALQQVVGAYTVTAAQAVDAGRYLGNLPGDAVSLPVSVTFWPQWPFHGMGAPTDARLLGLPLPPVFASVGDGSLLLSLPQASPPPGGGPTTDPFIWFAGLPPSESSTGYVGVVQVDAPFNDAYPDVAFNVAIPGACSSSGNCVNTALDYGLGATFGSATPQPITITRQDGSSFEGGWTAYFIDPTTLDVLSAYAPVVGQSPIVHPNGVNSQPVGATDNLILAPPTGSTLPILTASYENLGAGVTYPSLPPPLHVSGTVTGKGGGGVSATLLFYSTSIDDVTSCQAAGMTPDPQADLSYQALAYTNDLLSAKGETGEYSVDLPQGNYEVIVEPSLPSGYAKTTNGIVHVATPDHPYCSGPSIPLAGVDLDVVARVTLSGTAVTADGRALAAGTVNFTPASALAASLNTNPAGDNAWPRPFSTTTNDQGAYTISVDPGRYDMTVQPAAGTAFPWVVVPDSEAMQNALAPSTVVVPAPLLLSAFFHDNEDNPMAEATVQALAFTGEGVAVAIGQAVCDENGYFRMFLTSPTASR